MEFDGTQKTIGHGAQAEVLLYHGFAYKVYRPSYPEGWIRFEKQQQRAVNRAGLCPVRYYDTDDAHIIKMDLVEGDTLENRVREGYLQGFDLLAQAMRFVHEKDITGIDMPRFIHTASMGLSEEQSAEIMPVIERLTSEMKECVCHLDMHFLNIMTPKDSTEMTIIDWMNARIAPAVFDYARTYVIFDEFAKEATDLYMNAVLPDIRKLGISDSDFEDAVRVCTIIRQREKMI